MTRIVEVRMRANRSGEVRSIPYDSDWKEGDEGDSLYFWTEGNFGCDCNRSDIWYGDLEHDVDCGDEAFSVIDVRLDDGRIVVIDEHDRTARGNV